MKLKKTSLLDAAVMCGGIIIKKSRLLGAVCAGLLSIAASPALASVVYSYTGNPFDSFPSGSNYDGTNFITGTITLENLLTANTTSTPIVLDFSFTDGNQILSLGNGASIKEIVLTTDADGITDWKVNLSIVPALLSSGSTTRTVKTFNWGSDTQDTGVIQTVTSIMPFGPASSQDSGTVVDTSGIWEGSVTSAVPLPATAWLFGSGLLGLAGIARRKKTAPAEI